MPKIEPTGRERTFDDDDIIVSKTDLFGKITYANEVFMRVSGYSEHELVGAPHSIVRHPDMPRCVFKFAWDKIQSGHEIFAYVKNLAKDGSHYWVFAHLTPTFGDDGKVTGFHSNRRTPGRTAIAEMQKIYSLLLAEEQKHATKEAGMRAGGELLVKTLASVGKSYDELMFALEGGGHG